MWHVLKNQKRRAGKLYNCVQWNHVVILGLPLLTDPNSTVNPGRRTQSLPTPQFEKKKS